MSATPVAGVANASIAQLITALQSASDALRAAIAGAGATSGGGATTPTKGGGFGGCTCATAGAATTQGGGPTLPPTPEEPSAPETPAPPPAADSPAPEEPAAPDSPPPAAEAPAPAPPPPPAASTKPTFPLAGANADRSDGFGATAGRSRPHGGVDLTVPGGSAGKPILSMAAGKVVESGPNGGWGNTIVIEHANGYFTRYAHMVNPSPHAVGAEVTAGQELGQVGSTGESTGPHLHVEVMKGGTGLDNRVDPLPFLDGAKNFD